MQVFGHEEWKEITAALGEEVGDLRRRLKGAKFDDIEFQVWIASGNVGQIGSVLKYLDVNFRWSLSIVDEIPLEKGHQEWRGSSLHPFPIYLTGGGLRITDTRVGSFWSKMKVSYDAASQGVRDIAAVLAIFQFLTGYPVLTPDQPHAPPLEGCERVILPITQSEALIKPFREAGPGGYTVRAICTPQNGERFYFEWTMDRRPVVDDTSHVHAVQLLLNQSLPQTRG
ncbi:hypothetical protein [Streptomyces sp. NPDC057199]|uniref:hypothetical protein n=1 Tax=Streptomyces sp. NPDC057199 TaxID=3346047 RepID=UPI00362F22FE